MIESNEWMDGRNVVVFVVCSPLIATRHLISYCCTTSLSVVFAAVDTSDPSGSSLACIQSLLLLPMMNTIRRLVVAL